MFPVSQILLQFISPMLLAYVVQAGFQLNRPFTAQFDTGDRLKEIQHLTLHQNRLYIGATNRLYQLNASTLRLQYEEITGPMRDSPLCNSNGKCLSSSHAAKGLNASKILMPNVNKILLVYEHEKILISCGSLFQGICDIRRIENIKRKVQPPSLEPVTVNSGNATSVAVIAPAPDGHEKDALYVAVEYTYPYFRQHFPALSTRSLKSDSMFKLILKSVIHESDLTLASDYQEDFPIRYVGSFYAGGFIHWLMIQKENRDPGSNFVTKIGRVCRNDAKYESYSEVPLRCLGSDNSVYNLLQDYAVSDFGPDLQQQYGRKRSSIGTKFFVGIFAKGPDPDHPLPKSAICIYPLSDFYDTFRDNIKRCDATSTMPHYSADGCAVSNAYEDYTDSKLCIKAKVGGKVPVDQSASKLYNDVLLQSVVVDIVDSQTILLAGDSKGNIKKLIVPQPHKAEEYGQIILSPGLPIGADMLIDRASGSLFVPAVHKVFKVPTESCHVHSDCATCVQSKDPYCGWCTLENKCTRRTMCQTAALSGGWLKMGGDNRCPRVLNVIPRNISLTEDKSSFVRKITNSLNR